MNRILKLYKIVTCPRFAKALMLGCAATVEHEPILRKSGFVSVIDIGANRGQFAIMVREYLPTAVIHSVEPLTEPAQVLQRLMRGDKRFFLHTCAIGASRETTVMHVSNTDYASSLLPMGERMRELFPSTAERKTQSVTVVPLSDLLDVQSIEAPALLKIDVQGYELQVLRGCADLLNRFASVLVECAFVELYVGQPLASDVTAFLHSMGFHIEGVYDTYCGRGGLPIQADFLFAQTHQ